MISDAELIYNFLSSPGPVPDKADVIIALGTYDLRVADYAAEVFLSAQPPRRSFLQSAAAVGEYRRRTFSSRPPRPIRVKTSAFQGSFCLSVGFSLRRVLPSASPTWQSAPGRQAQSSGRK